MEPSSAAARLRRVRGPVVAAVSVGLASAYLGLVDPNTPGHYPVCPTKALTGLDCPGCGGLRCVHSLVTGDLAGALDHNVLVAVGIPIAVALWAAWLVTSWRGSPLRLRLPTPAVILVCGVILAFTVARNLVPYLGSA